MSMRFGISDAMGFSWSRYKEQPGMLIGAIFFAGIAVAIPFIAFMVLVNDYAAIAFVCYVLGIVVAIFAGIGFVAIGLKIADKQAWEMPELFAHAKLFFRYLGASILYSLIMMGGMLLFILPGVYWMVRFSLYTYFIIDKNQGVVESLKSSWALTDGSFWDLFAFTYSFGALMYVSMIPFGLGLFVTMPMMYIAQGYIYRQLQQHPSVPVV